MLILNIIVEQKEEKLNINDFILGQTFYLFLPVVF
jgi:hypothetical protein